MHKAGLVLLPDCSICDVSVLLTQLRHRDWRLRVLSPDGNPVQTAEGVHILADASLQDNVPLDLQLLIIPGGYYTSLVWDDSRLHRFLRQYDGQRGWMAASGEGVLCMAAAQLLGGTMYSAPVNLAHDFAHILRHAIHRPLPVTVDANLVSSDGSDPLTFAQVVCQRMDML